MKLSTTLDQLLRLVIVSGEESKDDEKRRDLAASAPSPQPQLDPLPMPPVAAGSRNDQPWRAQYTPPAAAPDDHAPARPWEARFTPEQNDDSRAEPERDPVIERQPVDPQPARPWEVHVKSEESVEPTYEPKHDEPEPFHHEPAEPDPDPWQSRFTPPEEPFTREPQAAPMLPPEPTVTPEPAEEPRSPAAFEHVSATQRTRLEQLEAAVTVAESLNLGLHLGLAVERIALAAQQGSDGVGPLKEAAWLIERYISLLEKRPIGADLHQSAARLARTGDAIQEMKHLASSFRTDPDPDEPGRIRRLSD